MSYDCTGGREEIIANNKYRPIQVSCNEIIKRRKPIGAIFTSKVNVEAVNIFPALGTLAVTT